jgi:hypothetical protein
VDQGEVPTALARSARGRYRLLLGLAAGAASFVLAAPALATDNPTTPPPVETAQASTTSDAVSPDGPEASLTDDHAGEPGKVASSDTTTAATPDTGDGPNGNNDKANDAKANDDKANDAKANGINEGANDDNANGSSDNGDTDGNNGNSAGNTDDGGATGVDDAAVNNNTQADGNGENSGSGNGSAAAEQSVTVDQTAAAAAAADQAKVTNHHASVRVDKPGNGPKVSQENTVTADASASTAAGITTSAPPVVAPDLPATDAEPSTPVATPTTDVGQHATAVATATQEDASNLNVSVRVQSPGDDGDVIQANSATATASAVAGSPAVAAVAASGTTDDAASATAAATQRGVSNTNISVRVFSPGDGGGVRQTNTAAASAAGDSGQGPETGPSSFRGANATTTQTEARNTNVTIRVASPGDDAEPIQTNANGSNLPGDSSDAPVTVEQTGLTTNVAVNVNGNSLPTPLAGATDGTITVWRWTWNWVGNGEADAIPTDVSSWNWNWDGTNGPSPVAGTESITSEQASAGLVAGTWTWNWVWSRPGTWTWNWAPTLALDCQCVWIWDWSWDWTDEPADATTAQAAAAQAPGDTGIVDGAAVAQSNAAAAIASATAAATADASVEQSAASGQTAAFAGQIITVEQHASAAATALQHDTANVLAGSDRAAQTNTLSAEATAVAGVDALQQIEQAYETETGASTPDGTVEQWAGQQIEVTQTVVADTSASQSEVINHSPDGTNGVVALAGAHAGVVAQQQVDQAGVVDGGGHSAWAGQLFQSEQIAEASARTIQTDDAHTEAARPRTRTARSEANATTEASSLQSATQLAAGGTDSSQVARQLVQVLQGSSATATTTLPAHTHVSPGGDSIATSGAQAVGRAFAEELSTQISIEGGYQETTQNISFLQLADATSAAVGGVSGGAQVVNCATVQQSSRQAIGADALGRASSDATTFCTPASETASEPAAPVAANPLDPGLIAATALSGSPHAGRYVLARQAHLRRPAVDAFNKIIPGPRVASRAPAAPYRVAAALSISTPTSEGAAQQSPLPAGVGAAGGKPALPSAPGSVDGAGSALPALGGGSTGGVADTPSRRYATPNGYRVAWAVPTVRRSEHYSGRFETPG